MLNWLNFSILMISSFLFTYFYVKSVKPASLEKRIGSSAYQKCTNYRMVSSIFMLFVALNFIIYHWFPLPMSLPRYFPWPYGISVTIAAIIGIPSLFLMAIGIKDAGKETMQPDREHKMYGGIYNKIRHPQAIGEFPFWWVLSFLVNSPFLAILSFIYIPVWFYFCIAEEQDLKIRYGKPYEEYCQKTGFWIPKNQFFNRN